MILVAEEVTFAQRLKELRKEKDLTQYKLAEELGFSRGLIGNYELGTREPDHTTTKILADFFGVSIDYLLAVPMEEPTIRFRQRWQRRG